MHYSFVSYNKPRHLQKYGECHNITDIVTKNSASIDRHLCTYIHARLAKIHIRHTTINNNLLLYMYAWRVHTPEVCHFILCTGWISFTWAVMSDIVLLPANKASISIYKHTYTLRSVVCVIVSYITILVIKNV